VRTLEHASKLIRWLKDNGEDVESVQRSGGWFDLEECRLKDPLPSKRLFWVLWVAIALFSVAAVYALSFAVDHRAYLKVIKSGTWFQISPKAEQAVRGAPWELWWSSAESRPKPLLPEVCAKEGKDLKDALMPTQFSAEDASVICDLFRDAKAPEFLSRSLWLQRIPLAAIAFLCIAFAYIPLRESISIDAAHNMLRRIRTRSPQAELNFDK
jgi:hypothetical protein